MFTQGRRMVFLASLGWSLSAAAFDGISLDIGKGHDDVKIVRLSTWIRQWERGQEGEKYVNVHQLFWELGLAYWRAPGNISSDRTLVDLGATPVMRFPLTRDFFADLGIGVHVLSDHRIGKRELSTPYHFGSLAGIGLKLGERYDLSLRIQHLSNASVDLPNPGINFTLLRFGVHF